MKNAKKIVVLLLCAVLLIGASVAGTMAYLTFETNTVTNTFTVGKVNLGENGEGGLDEAKVDEYGKAVTPAERVIENKYKLIPGHEYTKDPTIHIVGESESCWLFVRINNGIKDIEATGDTTIAAQMATNGWVVLDADEGIYALNAATDKVEADNTLDVKIFESFTLKTDADVTAYADATITIVAYAVQADGFATAEAAWNATFGAAETE